MRLKLSGPLRYRLQIILILIRSAVTVILRRTLRGPLVPGWDLQFEASSHFQKALYKAVYRYQDIHDGRRLLDALGVGTPSLDKVAIETLSSPISGEWVRPVSFMKDRVILFCHGGYAFYARAERALAADLSLAAGIPVFSLDYRLTPEHPFPAQLQDAAACYDWLLGLGYQASDIVVLGASAGGNLCLSLLLHLRELNRPLPRLAIALCPWTDIGNSGESIGGNDPYDIIDRGMIEQGASWLLAGQDPRMPLISPIFADLRGLPPVYLQAGGREIFIDMIRAFHACAESQGVDIVLDVWESMNHLFQAYGDQLRESKEALQRIAALVKSEEKSEKPLHAGLH